MKEGQPGTFINIVLILISAILMIVFGVCIFLALKNEDFGIINYISITSSFSVALLTVICVYASTKQMHVMKLQLEEMKREHMLQTQPILVLNQPEFVIEAPRFFYSPPQDRFSFQSRFFYRAMLVNASDDPGIVINIVAKISIPHGEDTITLHTFNKRYSISTSKATPNKVHFLFIDDLNCALFDSLRDHKRITIDTVIYYKNTSGACFSTSNTYRFSYSDFVKWENSDSDCRDELDDPQSIIREWHTAIVQAPIKYKESLKRLKDIVHNSDKREEYEQIFKNVKADFSSMYTVTANLKCQPYEANDSFELKTISKEDFEKASDNSDYLKSILGDNK